MNLSQIKQLLEEFNSYQKTDVSTFKKDCMNFLSLNNFSILEELPKDFFKVIDNDGNVYFIQFKIYLVPNYQTRTSNTSISIEHFITQKVWEDFYLQNQSLLNNINAVMVKLLFN